MKGRNDSLSKQRGMERSKVFGERAQADFKGKIPIVSLIGNSWIFLITEESIGWPFPYPI